MSEVQEYLARFDRALLTRGRLRRRALAECRDHLTEAALLHGDTEAVRRFGTPTEIAAAFDTETAARRAARSVVVAPAAVLAVAGSTLALLNASHSPATGGTVVAWAVVFFGAAQTSAVSTVLALLHAVASRHAPPVPSQLRLLGRRHVVALGSALVAEFAAGAAVPGRGSPAVLLAGPVLAICALAFVLRSWSLARRLDDGRSRSVRSPLTDVRILLGRRPRVDRSWPVATAAATALVAVPAAFAWNHADHGSLTSSFAAAGTELVLLVLGFAALGGALGLRGRRPASR